jgi:hypothetical protein
MANEFNPLSGTYGSYGNTTWNPTTNQGQGTQMLTGAGPGGQLPAAQGTGAMGNFLGGIGNGLYGGFVNSLTNAVFGQPQQQQNMQALPELTQGGMGQLYANQDVSNATGQSSSGLGANSGAYSSVDPQQLMNQYTQTQQNITDYNNQADENNNPGFFRNISQNVSNMFK